MGLGFHPTNLADVILNFIRGVDPTPPAGVYFKMHTGDPGSAGTANASAVTTRSQGTYAAAANSSGNRVITLTGTKPSFTATGTESWSHISAWDASTSGNVLFTAVLATPKSMTNTDVFTLDTATVTIPSSALMS